MPRHKKYDGPVCFVGHDHEAADGRELVGGFHYTVIEGPDGSDMPGEPLIHEDDAYRLAVADDVSHHERHHKQFVDVIPELSPEDRERLRKLLDAQEGNDE